MIAVRVDWLRLRANSLDDDEERRIGTEFVGIPDQLRVTSHRCRNELPRNPRPMHVLLQPIIRRFLRNNHIVNVALTQPGRRNAQKPRILLKLLNRMTTAIAHARA